MVIADLASAAAVKGGIANMRINIKDIKDAEVRTRYEEMIRDLET